LEYLTHACRAARQGERAPSILPDAIKVQGVRVPAA